MSDANQTQNPERREAPKIIAPGVRFFQEIKGLTFYGFYTSKIGMEQELEYGGGDYHTEFPGACNHPGHINQG